MYQSIFADEHIFCEPMARLFVKVQLLTYKLSKTSDRKWDERAIYLNRFELRTVKQKSEENIVTVVSTYDKKMQHYSLSLNK